MTICQDPEAEETAAADLAADSEEEALAEDPEAVLGADITVDLEVPRAEDFMEVLSTAADFSDREDIIMGAAAVLVALQDCS